MYEDEVVNVTLSQYGDWMAFTDVIEDTHEDPALNKMSEVPRSAFGAVKGTDPVERRVERYERDLR